MGLTNNFNRFQVVEPGYSSGESADCKWQSEFPQKEKSICHQFFSMGQTLAPFLKMRKDRQGE
jgi:hypothetical protein